MRLPWEVAVLIPAHDEELLLRRCLESVLGAIAFLAPSVRARVVVISDSSTDRTLQIAREILGSGGTVLSTEAGTVGTARALAVSHVIETTSMERIWEFALTSIYAQAAGLTSRLRKIMTSGDDLRKPVPGFTLRRTYTLRRVDEEQAERPTVLPVRWQRTIVLA